jgi:hypothetical protein
MKQPSAKDAFDTFIATDDGKAYLASPLFKTRLEEIDRRLDAGELMTVQAMADFVQLPLHVWRYLLGNLLAREAASMGEPPSGAKH